VTTKFINSYKGALKENAKDCIKAFSTLRSSLICASCDNKNSAIFKTGVPLTATLMNPVLKSCSKFFYIVNVIIKPALIQALNYASAVKPSAA